jgi:8-oxo-dGTP diphosphatase
MNKIIATLCYLESDGKILMLHRVKKQGDIHKNKWNGLGGKLESGESPKICALREIKEESGLTVNNLQFCGHITFPIFDGKNDWHCFLYHGSDLSGELIDSPEGILDWIDKDKVLELPLWDGDKIFIPWVLEKKHFMARFIYEESQFKSYEVDFF